MPGLSTTSFGPANEVLRHLYGPSARVVDSPTRGVVGKLDPEDRFERKDPATDQVKKSALGKRRYNDVAFRLAVVRAAHDLAGACVNFSGDDPSDRVNGRYWTLDDVFVPEYVWQDKTLGDNDDMVCDGKMMCVKPGVKPSAALTNIFKNGGKYGFECATAMMVIYHKAILDTVGEKAFDNLFSNLGFYRWSLKAPDFEALERVSDKSELVPGCHYFYENPAAAEEHAAFRGENVIYLGESDGSRMFYAHGVVGDGGEFIVTEEQLIESLRNVRTAGSDVEPYRRSFCYELDANALSRLAAHIDIPKPPR